MADWDFYQANVNEKIASIYLDLDAQSDLDPGTYSMLCWLFIRLKVERADGLSHEDEFDVLCDYEDRLDEHLKNGKIEMVGRVTTDGMRQFYFYSAPNFDFESSVKKFVSTYSSHQYQFGCIPDPDWSQYENVLYPGEHGLDQINERRENAGRKP
ncbi:DUF695 domain-containing protein [Grimontia sp. NTOU-MAR1]|uniref:DUF695 domain-containing protein n=1 Tax=Grimontia sp. NTOU-MAR1 TaxID=3111011 RepID=UPI002DBE89FD|nr:DUF695 domain-containing protein [Grimontia sp. NTOU-MAR1]WRV98538.1 DUF695 domain-containing protein [Grimontia sp. NTOU-MAR1]